MRFQRLLAATTLALTLWSCTPDTSEPRRAKSPSPQELFVDATDSSGVRFQHFNGRNGEFYYPANHRALAFALLDYNNDGKLDILVLTRERRSVPLASLTRRRNPHVVVSDDLAVNPDGTRSLKFTTDVTEASGLCSADTGMDVAVGDIDNDGCVDVFITHFGAPNQLFRNNCDGTFADVSKKAGVAGDGRWGASATFVDYDRDGLLDLYVANYVDYKIEHNQKCYATTSARDYCAPSAYKTVPGILYRNRGDGTFEDVSVKSGIARAYGAGLGVMAVDLNNDGWPDIYVANDGNPNQLWINQKDGTFKNEADIRGWRST
jgi:hypothetical protein